MVRLNCLDEFLLVIAIALEQPIEDSHGSVMSDLSTIAIFAGMCLTQTKSYAQLPRGNPHRLQKFMIRNITTSCVYEDEHALNTDARETPD